jgi:hypothetical protein
MCNDLCQEWKTAYRVNNACQKDNSNTEAKYKPKIYECDTAAEGKEKC